ncbi:Acyl- sterol acyltransferase protein [Rutstroemia sp. NJR-2017a BBW]|nr:Acyl- sterol acyltransferase protein [Rutstroemia sp. NJR-2017a BBW]
MEGTHDFQICCEETLMKSNYEKYRRRLRSRHSTMNRKQNQRWCRQRSRKVEKPFKGTEQRTWAQEIGINILHLSRCPQTEINGIHEDYENEDNIPCGIRAINKTRCPGTKQHQILKITGKFQCFRWKQYPRDQGQIPIRLKDRLVLRFPFRLNQSPRDREAFLIQIPRSNGQDCSDNKHLLASHPPAPAVPQDDLMMQFESSIDQVPNRRITLKTGKAPASQKLKLMQVRKFLRNPWGKKPNVLHEKTKDGGLDGSERRLRQWKSRCFIASVFMGSVLIIHVVFMIWAAQRSSGGANIGSIYRGECATVDNINTGLHVLINITTMIATMASACGMYFLSSPTRKEVDEAHAQGRSLDIGILSLRNLRTWKKKVLFGVLIISLLPIHFLGNSIVFTASPMLDYDVVIATPLFLNNTTVDCSQDVSASCTSTDGSPTVCSTQPLNSSSPQYTTNLCNTATSLHHNFTQNQLHHLNTTECLTAYSTLSNPSSNYANLLVITKTQPLTTNNSILLAFHHLQYTSVLTSPHTWTCGPDDPLPGQNTCDIPNLILNSDIWTLGPPLLPISPPSTSTSLQQTPSQRWEIDYCLASPLPSTPLCELQYSRLITLIQIACTGIKFLAMLIITFGFGSTTVLANVADAVASFRERSDAVTSHRNLIHRNSAWKSRDGLLILEPEVEGKERKLRWFHGASLPLWVGGLFFSATLLTTTLILLTTSTIPIPSPYTLPPGRTSPLAILKIFSFSSQTFVPAPHTTTAQLFLAAILTNAPQLLVSVAVFLLEQIYIRMQAARTFSLLVEDNDMTAKRKIPTLRERCLYTMFLSQDQMIWKGRTGWIHASRDLDFAATGTCDSRVVGGLWGDETEGQGGGGWEWEFGDCGGLWEWEEREEVVNSWEGVLGV